ncbi:MAG: lysoplasmalogenase family protein [Candidatus Caccovivens sp.]
MLVCVFFGIFSLIFCLLFCWFRTKTANVYSLVLKTMSSICFILCAVFAVKTVGSSSVNLLIVTGLVMGLIGDILLDLKIMYPQDDRQYFVAGTTSFAIGHLFYFMAVCLYTNAVLPANLGWNILASVGVAILLTLAIILPSGKLGLNFGKNIYMVVMYSFVLTFMMSISVAVAIFNPTFWIFAVGMILFFASDLVLSLQYFGGKSAKVWVWVNHILYYMAQIMLAVSILYLI